MFKRKVIRKICCARERFYFITRRRKNKKRWKSFEIISRFIEHIENLTARKVFLHLHSSNGMLFSAVDEKVTVKVTKENKPILNLESFCAIWATANRSRQSASMKCQRNFHRIITFLNSNPNTWCRNQRRSPQSSHSRLILLFWLLQDSQWWQFLS